MSISQRKKALSNIAARKYRDKELEQTSILDIYGKDVFNLKTMKDFLETGYDLILDVDPRGARELKKNYPGGIFVFVLPPSIDVLKERLEKRGSEKDDIMSTRLKKAMDEIKEIVWYDYIVTNDSLNSAIDNLRSIYVAEKSRRERLTEKIKEFMEVST